MWLHADYLRLPTSPEEQTRLDLNYHDLKIVPPACIYCGDQLDRIGAKGELKGIAETDWTIQLHACRACGWWVITRRDYTSTYEAVYRRLYRSGGVLRELDVSDIQVPVAELQRYLVAKYESRFNVTPRRFEEIVAGVFADFGYAVRVTSFSGDNGIDAIVLDGERGDEVGVQVKRYRGKVEAEQIRAFAGALLLHNYTKGVFVTTSTFTAGAAKTARAYDQRGVAISLWDSGVFYDRLRVSRHAPFVSGDVPDAPFSHLWLNPEEIPQINAVDL